MVGAPEQEKTRHTLANGGDWQDSSLQATVVGDQNVVTVDTTAPTAPTGFFRLRGQ